MPTTIRWRAVFAAALVAGGFGAVAPAFGQGEAESLSASFRKAARRVMPAVVTIRPVDPLIPFGGMRRGLPFGPGPRGFGPGPTPPPAEVGGSGVVIDADKGFVLTNDHVIQNASRVIVVLQDGHERMASQVRRDPKSDLALLVIDGKGLAQAEWGDSDALDTGDWVLAIGHPFGLADTVTAGIVSGKGRGVGMTMYEDLIQTDAAINPGNSGGPLVNLKGQVVGINAAMLVGNFDGIGFAIPSSRARRVAADLADQGRVRRAYLGIQIGPLDPATADRVGHPGAVVVNGVSPDSPASEAGLRRGDIVLELNGKPLAGVAGLQAAIEVAPVDVPVTLTIDRDGERREVKVAPKAQPDSFGLGDPDLPGLGPRPAPAPRLTRPLDEPALDNPRETAHRTSDVAFPALGLRLSAPTPALAQRHRINQPVHGVVVVGVDPDSPADRGGLELGMVLTHVGDHPVESIADVGEALAKRAGERTLVVRILKGTKAEYRVLPEIDRAKDANKPAPRDEAPPNPNSKPEQELEVPSLK